MGLSPRLSPRLHRLYASRAFLLPWRAESPAEREREGKSEAAVSHANDIDRREGGYPPINRAPPPRSPSVRCALRCASRRETILFFWLVVISVEKRAAARQPRWPSRSNYIHLTGNLGDRNDRFVPRTEKSASLPSSSRRIRRLFAVLARSSAFLRLSPGLFSDRITIGRFRMGNSLSTLSVGQNVRTNGWVAEDARGFLWDECCVGFGMVWDECDVMKLRSYFMHV